MAQLVILGSAAAVCDPDHDNTHFLLVGDSGQLVLVDAGSNPLRKLPRFDISHAELSDIILTHFHPDHVSGLPIMMMQMWLLGRQAPLQLYGLHHCLHRVDRMMDMFQWDTWPNFPPVNYHYVAEQPGQLVLDNADFRIHAWPTRHFVPTIGLRIEVKSTGNVIGYSCDTEPVPEVVELAQGADLLLHEAAGAGFGHSSAAQAGMVAREANVGRLVLIHYNVYETDPAPLVDEARQTFNGPVELAKDYTVYTI